MGAFDCPKCKMVRHIDEGGNLRDDKCWYCGTTVYTEAEARALEDRARERDGNVTSELPRGLARVIARRDVPCGHIYRMWTTRGEMIAYANSAEIADLPREIPEKPGIVQLRPAAFWGVPIVIEADPDA